MQIPIVSHSYPTQSDPSYGIFIRREVEIITRFASPYVIIPKVYATPLNRQFFRTLKPAEDRFPKKQFSYLSFPRRLFPRITQKSFSKNLLQVLGQINNKLVHLHWLFPQSLAVPALKQKGYKVIQTIHGGDWYSNLNNQTLFSIIKNSLLATDAIVCVGKKLADDLKKKLPETAEKVLHIPHAIDTEIFNPQVKGGLKTEKELWNPDKKHLLCVANFYKVKGVDLLLKAFSELNDNNLHLHLVAPRSDKKTSATIRSIISNNKLHHHVTIYGTKKETELADFYRNADIFILPSLKEGFGIVCAEAAACGTPVLATKSGGPEEIIDEQTGILADANNVQALINGIEMILKKPEVFDPKEMHNQISNKFGMNTKTDRLKELYSSVVKGETISGI